MDIDGKKLKDVRENVQLSQSSLATMAGVSRTYISALENDKCNNPDPEKVAAIARALDVSPASICTGPVEGEVVKSETTGKRFEARCVGGRRRMVEV